jgi:hypothetical protein
LPHETSVFYLGPLEEMVLLAVDSLKESDYQGFPDTKNHFPRDACAVRVKQKLEEAMGQKLPHVSAYRALRRLVAREYLVTMVLSDKVSGVRYKAYVLTNKAISELKKIRRVRKILSKTKTAA